MSRIPRHRIIRRKEYARPTVSPAIVRPAPAQPTVSRAIVRPAPAQPSRLEQSSSGRSAVGRFSSRKILAMGTLMTALGALYIVGVPFPSGAASGGIHDSGIQELDGSIDFTGNTTAYGTTTHDTVTETAPAYDWNSLFTAAGPGGSITTTAATCQVGSCAGLINAVGLPYNGELFTKGSKDANDVSSWSCTQQANPPKDQLVNTYGAAWTAQQTAGAITTGDTVMFLGLERPNTSGNSNAGFWLFKNKVLCDQSTGTFTGSHANGDVFIVGSFLGGGTNAVLTETPWVCAPVSATDPTCQPTTKTTTAGLGTPVSGSLNCPAIGSTTTNDIFCEAVNQKIDANGTITNWDVHTPWSNLFTGGTGSGDIPGPGFLEMGIDLSRALGSAGTPAPCFASFLADTRSSGSTTQAETKDFINGAFPTCGNLSVHKYIDQNLNGHFDGNPPDLNGGGWPISVKGPSGTTICSGTTDASGNLTCGTSDRGLNNLPAGSYTVSETQKAGFYNTDPGTGSACNDAAASSTSPPDASDVNESATVSCQITVSNGANTTAQLGNQCLVSQAFAVDNLPAGTTGVNASFTVTAGFDKGATGTVALSPSNGTYVGTSTFPFIQNDVLNWSFYINSDPSHSVPGASGVTSTYVFSPTTGTAACAHTSHGAFKPSAIEGFKFKDVTGTGFDGSGLVPQGDPPLGGVQFQLLSGTTVVGTATSSFGATGSPPQGSFTFNGVNPGTYTVQEVVPSNWVQTAPTSPSTYTVTIHLGDGTITTDTAGHTLNFLDTPTYNFGATFNSLANLPGTTTPATKAAINCSPSTGSSGSGTGTYSSGTQQGASQTYNCTIAVSDP